MDRIRTSINRVRKTFKSTVPFHSIATVANSVSFQNKHIFNYCIRLTRYVTKTATRWQQKQWTSVWEVNSCKTFADVTFRKPNGFVRTPVSLLLARMHLDSFNQRWRTTIIMNMFAERLTRIPPGDA